MHPSKASVQILSSSASAAATAPSGNRICRNVLLSSLIFFGALVLAVYPDIFDRPITGWMNSYVGRWPVFDRVAIATFVFPTFSGCLLMALIWSCWFDTVDRDLRARILAGTLASFGAGLVSRLLQYTVPTHLRPVYDKVLAFQQLAGFNGTHNTWNSFPSDHATVFTGLALVIWFANSRFAVFAVVLTLTVELARTYVGGHFPSDLIGAAGLSAVVIWSAQAGWFVAIARWLAKFEQKAPSLFYMCAFFISYQIASLFLDVRNAASLVRQVL
jgi:membrane-associated phospholipid phosphatase